MELKISISDNDPGGLFETEGQIDKLAHFIYGTQSTIVSSDSVTIFGV